MKWPTYFNYWGKTKPSDAGGATVHLLVYHCLDVAAAARAYLERHRFLLDYLRRSVGIANEEKFFALACVLG